VWTVSIDKGCGMFQEWKTETKDTAKVGLGYMNKGKDIVLAFSDSSWAFKKDEEFTVSLGVDKGWKGKVPGAAVDKTTAVAVLPASSDAINALMNGRELFMEVDGKSDDYGYTYYLDDTRKAIAALDACRAQAE